MANRFIPTCVGNGSVCPCALDRSPVHPHVCGEREVAVYSQTNLSGSSPRVWGTVGHPIGGFMMTRFIPTCVGNGLRGQRLVLRQPVHPHVCGERVVHLLLPLTVVGSSPRVWGTVCADRPSKYCNRFIPTCVGNGGLLKLITCWRAVHPHVCGERLARPWQDLGKTGSSPRVWGTAGFWVGLRQMWRFIPTCVGNGQLRQPCQMG